MSKNILTLASDLASFNNIDPTEALEKLRSGLAGEAEPLRALGVNISETAVKAKAMELGLGGVGRELASAEKVTARYALIVDQTKNAQGDFARTSDGLANSQRIAKAEAEDLSAEMGKALLPIMAEGTRIVKGLMEKFMSLSPEMRNTILIVVGIIAVVGPLLIVFGTLLTVLPAIGGAFLLLTGPIGLIILTITLLALVWATNMGDIQGKTKVVIGFLQDLFDGFKLLVLNIWRGIVTGIANAVNGIIEVINGFIGSYNELAGKLGLPLIGKIELITPNLAGVDAAINQVARDRAARIYASVYDQAAAGGGGTRIYQEGTHFVPSTGPAIVHRGEAIIPARANPWAGAGSVGTGVTVVFSGPVYGMQDFDDRVRSAVREATRGGGFRGVIR